MELSVFCIAKNEEHAIRIANRLRQCGFSSDDISVLAPQGSDLRDLTREDTTKAPEGTAAGASAGEGPDWPAGIGTLAIPGFGPLMAAGPILNALPSAAESVTVGGMEGALIGLGIPEYDAHQYAAKLKEGRLLMAVHTEIAQDANLARQVLKEERAGDVSMGTETAAR